MWAYVLVLTSISLINTSFFKHNFTDSLELNKSIMHRNPIHFSYLSITLVASPLKENFKNSLKQNKTKQTNTNKSCIVSLPFLPLHHLFICLSRIGSYVVQCSGPFCPNSFTCKCWLWCWTGSRTLVSSTPSVLNPLQNSSQTSCCYLESCRSYSYGSAGLVPCMLQQVIDVLDAGMGQLKSLDMCLGGS